LAKEAGLTDDENTIESIDKEADGLFIRDTLSLPQSQQQEQELEDEDGEAYERRIQQEIEEERLEEIEQERLRREREDDTESIRSQDTIDSVSRYELWRSEVTQYRCVDTRLLEIDDKGKPLLPEELNSAGRRSIPQGFTAQSDEGVFELARVLFAGFGYVS
jgi:outer membrane translocation and assembly module TamA